MSSQKSIFENLGAEFLLPQYKIAEKLQNIKAFVFDWDGVFNKGEKNATISSSFNEVDSMGTNLLRFSYFLKNISHGASIYFICSIPRAAIKESLVKKSDF